jgi:cellulose synthase/poly-beta-1,6-N-acetylglucosamine synthase-like glycosyltransferase
VEAKRWLKRLRDVKRDLQHTPTVTVAILTYNEARHIEEKLEDVYRQGYPCDRLEIIVVDSASTDGTAEKARWRTAAHCVLKQYNRQGVNALHVLSN